MEALQHRPQWRENLGEGSLHRRGPGCGPLPRFAGLSDQHLDVLDGAGEIILDLGMQLVVQLVSHLE